MMKLDNLSIKYKWILTAYIIGACSIIIILILLTGLKNSREDFQKFKSDYYEVEQLVKDNTITILNTAKEIRDAYIQGGKQSSSALNQNIRSNITKIQDNTQYLVERLSNTSMPMEDYKKNIDEWLNVGNQVLQAIEVNDITQAEQLLSNDCPQAIGKVINTAEQITLSINDSVANSIQDNIKSNIRISWISLGMLTVAGIVCGTLSKKMRSSILTPIEELRHVAENMKEGKYDVAITYASDDELGVLAESMKGMMGTTKHILQDTNEVLDRVAQGDLTHTPKAKYIGVFGLIESSIWKIISQMSDMIKQISNSVVDVSNGAEEIAKGATELAEKVAEQERIIDTFIECIDQVSDNIEQNIEQVNTTSHITAQTKEKATQGTEMMNKMLVSMKEISQSSESITEITKIIYSISEQTNLLALNAAIEAARAGEAGKGFAIVAGEVRDLANKSSETVKEIEKVIQRSIQSIKNGEEMVEGTAKVLEEVMQCIEETTIVSKKLDENTYVQQGLLDDLTQNTSRLKEAVHGNIGISQESAAISKELGAHSEVLRQQIERFKIN